MLSVVIITKNEAHNIRRCLQSVAWADEVIVLDSGSKDNTVSIAREFTDKVYTTKPQEWQGYGVQKQRALAKASGDWVLNLDADESVDSELKSAIISAMKSNDFDAYRIPIRLHFYHKTMRYSSSPTRHIRLFRREGAQYSHDIVHEKIMLPQQSRVGRIHASILHHSFRDISHALLKINRYSSYSAKIRLEEKKQAGICMTMMASCWMFLRCYLLQGGFLDGKEGLVLA